MGSAADTQPESTSPPNTEHDTELNAKLAQLEALFPGCIVHSGTHYNPSTTLDLSKLRQHLGSRAVGAITERYQLDWPGKQAARAAAAVPSICKLVDVPGDGVDSDTTGNLFIEGDNLDALKLLQQTHRDAFKLIYIDPPYNTGRDFTYQDDRTETEADYLLRTGQVSASGVPLVDNPETVGRFHSQWLSMLLPRLMLARQLLRSDGAIAVSVDDNEVGRLTCLLDEVFGKENRVVDFIWRTKPGAKGVPPRTMVTQNHEYILLYARDASKFRLKGRPRDLSAFSNPDNDPRGPWKKDNMKSTVSGGSEYSIVDPATGRSFKARWAFSESTVQTMISEGRVIFPANDSAWPAQKSFLNDYQNKTIPLLSILDHELGGTADGAKDIAAVLGSRDVFAYPKPVKLLSFLVSQIATQPDDTVMDFFAGSGTFGEAVLKANADDEIARSFVLVQLDDQLDPNKPSHTAAIDLCRSIDKPCNIAEIAKERIRRAGITAQEVSPNLDVGFCVQRLVSID